MVTSNPLGHAAGSDAASGFATARGMLVDGNKGHGDGSLHNTRIVHRHLALCAACAHLHAAGQPRRPSCDGSWSLCGRRTGACCCS
jgi:hypothetical protein